MIIYNSDYCYSGDCIPVSWNSLNVRDRSNRIRGSPSLESFKSNLKTLLFKEHFYPFSS